MQLNELVKNYSINTISQKTKIAIEVLEKLINKDWENLQQSKVNGFLKIIEREFDVDLSDIKEEAKEFYKEHQKSKTYRPIDLVDAQVEGGSSKRLIANILTFIILALVSYAIWYYLSQKKHNNFYNNTNDINETQGMFKNSLEKAKKTIKLEIKNEDNNSQKNIENIETNSNQENSKLVQESEKNSENKKFDITTTSQEEKNSLQANETNKTKEENRVVSLENTPKSQEENNSIASSEDNISNNSSTLTSNDTNSNSAVDINLDENLTNQDENLTNNENNTTLQAVNKITITPTVKKIWIGIYNLKTKKRVVKVATGAYVYNTDGADVAIVTGHSRFKITTDSGASSEYHDARKRKYLLVSKDGIKVLTKQEYRKVTKRRAW